jgi:hypothetical protein
MGRLWGRTLRPEDGMMAIGGRYRNPTIRFCIAADHGSSVLPIGSPRERQTRAGFSLSGILEKLHEDGQHRKAERDRDSDMQNVA